MPSTSTLCTLFGFIAAAQAHIKITTPVPMGESTLSTSPLKNVAPGSSGSDYPCQQRTGVYDISTINNMTVGAPQTLSFSGSASHGGGSCQLSVTYDLEPSASSVFKVVESIIGGCPTQGDSGGTQNYTFAIPKGMQNGRATFAWSWQSREAGQGEYYMNCAAIDIAGGVDNDLTGYNSLPDLYLVNLPNSECSSQQQMAVIYPDPGPYVTTMASTSLASASGPGCAALAAATGAPQGGNSSSPATTPAAEPSGGSSAPSASSAAGGDGTAYTTSLTTVAGASPSGSPYDGGSSPNATTPAGSMPTQAPGGGASPSSLAPGAGQSSCSSNGQLMCNGENMFGLCSNGVVTWQAVAAGTTCSNGAVVKRSYSSRQGIKHRYQKRVFNA